jgi:multidrug efflux pump subunit AcrB
MIRFFAGHPTGANLLLLLILAVGLAAAPGLRRETLPDFSTDSIQVMIVYPGATAEEVEEAVCERIEDAVDALADLEEVRCDAREGVATATLDMVPGAEVDRFLLDVKTEVDSIDDFPDLTEDPIVRQLNIMDRVVSLAITGPMAEPDLKVFAEEVKDRLVRLPVVSRVELQGFSDRQIRIEPDARILRQFGLSVSDIAAAVERQSVDLPAGTVETGERDVVVRFAAERETPLEFENLVVLAGKTGAELRLGQIARIHDRFELDEERVLFNGRRAALLEISKTKSQDTLSVLNAVRDFAEAERLRAPPGVEFALTRDIASIVQDRLDMLVDNSLQGLVLVLLVMWLFFSFRVSFWVALGLPVSFMGTVFVMSAIGYSINMLTMVALLIAIGLIMDDSIVIAENIARHRQRGLKPLEAAVTGAREVSLGVLSSFATSVCVFTPLAFLEGDLGKVLKVVPVVLIITLSVSLLEAFLILPHHIGHSGTGGPPGRFRQAFDAGFARVREGLLGRLVDLVVAWRYLTLGLVVMIFLASVGMLAGGFLKVRAFPDIDGDVIEARILLPQGTPMGRTEAVVERVVAALQRTDGDFAPRQPGGQALVANVLVQFNANADAFEAGPHVATVTADLLGSSVRDAALDDVLNTWRREAGTIPDVLSLTFKEPQIGPAGRPIDIRLHGKDLRALKSASRELMAWLGRYPGVTDLADDLRPGKAEFRLRLREGATALGLDAAAVAAQLRAAYYGETAAEIQVGAEGFEIDIRLRPEDQDSLADLDYFVVTTTGGEQVPLSALAEIETGRGVSRIHRIDGRRTVTISGEVDSRLANVNEILADTRARFLPDLSTRYPRTEISLEGESAEQAETGASMQRNLLVGILGIFLLLSFQFRSYTEPVIVLLALPMAAIGAIWGHLLMGIELSMPSFMGLASLAGVVVNDSILLVTFVKIHTARGEEVVDAARLASRDRFRPVLLTSLTTIAGLAPLLFERSLQAQILVPLVTSLAFGLLASTVLVLLVVPACYAILHDFGLTTVARDERESEVTAT